MTYKIEEEKQSVTSILGEMSGHRLPIRGVQLSANDHLFATNSFDSVKVWTVDLFLNSLDQNASPLTIRCKQSLDEPNILSMTILPGNKLIVLGTKSGELLLYELSTNNIIQRLKAH